MNPILAKILATSQVEIENEVLPLHSSMGADEGEIILKVFSTVKPTTSLEIGLAYGISTLYACDALSANGNVARHIVIDPDQNGYWRGIGLRNLELAGYRHYIDFHENRSELALPALLAINTRIQAAIIDGWHTFDHTLIDFFYINKMLDVGGIVIFDDCDYPSINRLIKYIKTYPAYRVFATTQAWNEAGPTCVALQKISEDQRNFDWHVDF